MNNTVGSNPTLSFKARDGLEPSLKDLQSFTLPLCYLAIIKINIYIFMKKSKKLFTYKNQIILTNGSSLKITSIKYLKNYQINFKIFKEIKNNQNLNQISNKNKLNFIKKIST